ncbi:MAG: AAA family ATPase [Chloroflexi bacterium]|nr:AAA family ATPase [Chloroflexota bacterium]MYF82548.1 AAA family ATPase [Chloroflexota bacterium]MYI05626.1 AAA family ATPase [Chloroflexota bacterium]
MTNPELPADQEVRERIINELDTSFFLEAGAGSGKTSVIVSRVVNLVRSGVAPSEIVAITFTEKAAGELRDRIRAELAAVGELAALRDLDLAPFQTIHAFAAAILRECALEAGLDPDVRVLDQLQEDLRFAQAWRSWLWSSDAPRDDLQRALDLGLSLDDLQLAAQQLSRNRDLDGGELALASDEEAPEDQRARDSALAELTAAVRGFISADAAQRRRDGALSYDDLLLDARDLLVRSTEARDELRRRYRTILVDEFQDTDPLQAQIALLLAADPDTEDWTTAVPGPGRLVLAGDPKQSIYRFRRADIDVYEQVREIFESSPQTCAIAGLSVSFRSRPRLCAWQNRILPAVLKPDADFPRAQARWSASTPHRSDRGIGVAVIPGNRQFDRAPDARAAESGMIASLITHMHGAASGLGQLPSEDTERAPQFRDIAILFRTRAGADIYTAALDGAGIPYHFDSGQGFYQRPEIRAVAHLLQALDDPQDEVAAIAVLKSPLIAASDQELFDLRGALGAAPLLLQPAALPEDYEGRLRAPIRQLAALREELPRFPLPELVDHVIRSSDLLVAQAVGVDPPQMRQRQANLRMLVQRAAHFADNHDDAMRPFVRWLSQRGVRNLPESESPTTEADDDAVRILTIHQAKGLEFPIVILPKLQDWTGAGVDFIVDRANERVEFKLGDDRSPFRSAGYLAALRRDRAYADAEARRMLYVAATRARDWLILSSFPADSLAGRDSFHTFLEDAAPHWLSRDADSDVIVVSPRALDAPSPPSVERSLPPHDSLLEEWTQRREDAFTGGRRRIETTTPSSIGDHASPEHEDIKSERAEQDRDQTSVDPLEFGSAVHDALEAADFDDPAITRERTIRICRSRRAPEEQVLAHVERAMESPLLQRARAAQVVRRELPLAAIAQDDEQTTITEGIADLVFSDAGRWVLVDYKSDAQLPPDRLAAYRAQVRRYATMLEAAGIVIDEAYLLLTATGEAVPVPVAPDADSGDALPISSEPTAD